jgi:hypothetical protein
VVPFEVIGDNAIERFARDTGAMLLSLPGD